MSRVMYNGSRLIPAPLITINKTYTKSGDGNIIGKIYNITINGTLVAYMGSPKTDGTFHTTGGYPADETVTSDARLWAIQRKQAAIRDLFSDEGKSFEVQALNAMDAVRFNPRINDISFEQGIWYDRCNYTITMEADELYPDKEDTFDEYISSADESWSIDINEEPETLELSRTYTLTHTVSAVGKRFFDETGVKPYAPWEYARSYVLDRLGFDAQIALSDGVNNLPSFYGGWNHVRNENLDINNGSFSVTETWVIASGSAIEDFTIQANDSIDNPYKKVTVDGSVRGLEKRNSNMTLLETKYNNALTKFTQVSGVAYLRAQQYSGFSNLNINPITWMVGKNPLQGTINYNFEYDTRPMNLIEGAKSEVISINDNIGGELFASVFVLGRSRGPVLQDLGTKPSNTRSLSIEILIDPPTYADRTVSTIQNLFITQKPSNKEPFKTSLENLIYAVNPTNNGYTTVFQDQPQENWSPTQGRFTYNCAWTYE